MAYSILLLITSGGGSIWSVGGEGVVGQGGGGTSSSWHRSGQMVFSISQTPGSVSLNDFGVGKDDDENGNGMLVRGSLIMTIRRRWGGGFTWGSSNADSWGKWLSRLCNILAILKCFRTAKKNILFWEIVLSRSFFLFYFYPHL